MKEEAEKNFVQLMKLHDDNSEWHSKYVDDKKGVCLSEDPSRLKLGGLCLRVEGTLAFNSSKQSANEQVVNMIDFLWKSDLKTRKSWEPDLIELQELYSIDENLRVERRVYHHSPFAPREFVR